MRLKLQRKFQEKTWSKTDQGPRSGPGSTLEATEKIRAALPDLFQRLEIRRFVDAPCGDWTWMQAVDLGSVDYFGGDIVPSIIEDCKKHHERDGVRFDILDITSTPLPPSDLFLCREVLFHLKFWLRWQFFRNFAASDGKYLMLTLDHVSQNNNLARNSGFQRFDPRLPPFDFPEPIELIPENFDLAPGETPAVDQRLRSSGIWSIEQIRAVVATQDEADRD